MPVTAEIGSVVGDDHQVIGPGWDRAVTPRAQVGLAGGVGLNRSDDGVVEQPHHPVRAQIRPAIAAATASTTIAMSMGERVAGRNGLNPMP